MLSERVRTVMGPRKHLLLTDFHRIHWRKFVSRKIVVLAALKQETVLFTETPTNFAFVGE